ncbi:hypothetical protein [Macrococcus carouselicus]|uniref:Uncharacterized protein n=1 Tax=Macrococcus carouselicus TaxID=69969 RepID=A0A9Q8CPT8_9STAP|nr:hypothetical protein [Macrococcus carouselicus]TDM04380.1 hypothetical protein ERX40_04210 [Macrococcus carouselicus]
MSIGTIVFIIGIIITVGQSLWEKKKKDDTEGPVIRKVRDFEQRVQTNIERLEQRTTLDRAAVTPGEKTPTVSPRAERTEKVQPKKQDKIERVLTDTHLTEQQKAQRLAAIKEQDLTEDAGFTFDITNENLVHGLIMAELLSPPKSKR